MFNRIPHPDTRLSGFTLIEVLVAIAVFGIGAVAVASIFPTAIFLQRQTVADVELRQFGYNVEALMSGRSIRFLAGGGFEAGYEAETTSKGGVPQLMPLNISTAENVLSQYALRDRSYPANYAPINATTLFVPMIYDANDAPAAFSWVLYAFVLERQAKPSAAGVYGTPFAPDPDWASADGPSFPSVRRVTLAAAPDKAPTGFFVNRFTVADGIIADYLLAPGVQFMDNNGVVYRLDSVDPNGGGDDFLIVEGFIPASPATPTDLWIAYPGNGADAATANPTRRILVFADADPDLEPKAPATPTHHVVP